MAVFSIIVPVYNVEKYLRQCLDSIVNQTFADFEVICVNDGSTDNSLEILEEYSEKDNRFIVINQENQGQGVARNKAMDLATGDYIVFVDPDDWIEVNLLEELYKTFKLSKSEVIAFNYKEYNDYSGKVNNRNLAAILKKNFDYNLNLVPYYSWRDVKSGCLYNLDLHAWSKAYSREFLKRIQAVFAPTKHGEDHLFVNIVLLNAEKIYYLDKYLYTYRCRDGSAVNKRSSDNFCIFNNIELLKDYLITHNFYEELKEEFNCYQTIVMSWHYQNIPEEKLEEYKSICQKYLTPQDYRKMLYKGRKHNTFWESIFSLKNEREFGIKRKVITLFGIKIKIKPKKKTEVL
ncbi:MAG: glycosyltransferase [Candidatus Gastranaerophilales bacterium]|nr:glycosyltransferase [Candidatus Gastranaerophilales bacterium]